MEQSFVLIKPDAVHRSLVGKIISDLENKGFKIIALKSLFLSDEIFYFLYNKLQGKPFHDQFKHVMQSGPSVALVLSGHNAVETLFSFCGAFSDPELDSTNSIRQKYSVWTGSDVVHRADSRKEAASQISHFFSKEELIEYTHLHEVFMSKNGYKENKDRLHHVKTS